MSHPNRRTIAAPAFQTPMDPPHKNNPKPAAKDRRHQPPAAVNHPNPDPSSTVQNLSKAISKLYSSNQKHAANSFEPQMNPRPQTKAVTFSQLSDTSCAALTKSSSQKESRPSLSKKDRYFAPKTKTFVELDVEKASKLMSKSMDSISNQEMKKDKDKKMLQLVNHRPQVSELRRRLSSSSVDVINNGARRRRSFCNSQVELADFLSCNGVRIVAVDMPPFMQIHAVDCARKSHDSLEKFTSKTLALTLKKEFDGAYGPAWHCIVGTSFGSFVTHSVGGFIYFSMDHKLYILLFKTAVQIAA